MSIVIKDFTKILPLILNINILSTFHKDNVKR
jgi:hypothetical protein